MEIKRGNIVVGLFMLVFVLFGSLPLSSAFYYVDARQISQQTVNFYMDFFGPIFEGLFGGYGTGSIYVFERFLLFILIFAVIWLVIGNISVFEKASKWVKIIIAATIPLIGMRFINYESLTSIFNQYVWASIAITAVLPLLIFFYVLYTGIPQSSYLRRILWLFFLLIYAGMWSSAQVNLNSDVYGVTSLVIILIIIFDKQIQRQFLSADAQRALNDSQNLRVSELRTQMDHISTNPHLDAHTRTRMLENLQSQINWWIKHGGA